MKEYEGKDIFVVLSKGAIYTGRCTKVEDDFIHMTDKFGQMVMFHKSDIKHLKENTDYKKEGQ
jgi:hypothetical protein